MRIDESFVESTQVPASGVLPAGSFARLDVGPVVRVTRADGTAFDVLGKCAVVVAMVALDGRAERGPLAAMLWPSSPDRQARNNLRTLVHRFNQRVGAELLIGAEHLSLDLRRIRLVTQDPESLAVALENGGAPDWELLSRASVDVGDSDPLAQWLESARQRMRQSILGSLAESVLQVQARGDLERAALLAKACVQLDPLSERWHRQLMESLALAGDRAAALAAYEQCKLQLLLHLGVLPDAQTRKLHLRILQGAAGDGTVDAAIAEATRASAGSRFPLIERDGPLAQARSALLAGQHVAIEGEPGVGKTRLLGCLQERGSIEAFEVRGGLRDAAYAAAAQWLLQVQAARAVPLATADQIELARICPQAFPGVEASHAALSPLRLHDAFRHWMRRLAEAGVKVLAIDDVHHADAASQAVFAALLSADGDFPALLLAHRSGDITDELEQALVAAQVRKRARRIFLSRLSPHGVRQLLEAIGTERPESWFASAAAQLHRRTGGNPLFVIELARHEFAESNGTPHSETAQSLRALLQSRVRACSQSAQHLAALAAVAGDQFSVELAASVLGLKPLALMPAWNELQQRGLFADDGLAHDMVLEAVRGILPAAIVRALHGDVAAFLERLGMRGVTVLSHWRSAAAFDRALSHAVHALHADSAAGHDTTHLEQELLDILMGVQDTTLIENLWLSAEIHEESMPSDGWSRIESLIQRVRGMHRTASSSAWLAYETARVACFQYNEIKRAYETLGSAVGTLPERGVERARAELLMLNCSYVLDGYPRDHVRRAQQAVQDLGEALHYRRLRRQIESAAALFGDPRGALWAVTGRLRAARRRCDGAAADEARVQLASIQAKLGNFSRAQHHLAGLAAQASASGSTLDRHRIERGFVALNCGLYDEASRYFETADDRFDDYRRKFFLALLRARLGQWREAARLVEPAHQPAYGRHINTIVPMTVFKADLLGCLGDDPLPVLRQSLDLLQDMKMGGIYPRMLDWEVRRRTASLDDRIQASEELIACLKSQSYIKANWLRPLIECAEAHAERQSERASQLAREAASALRRGYATPLLYTPDALLRCARLLEVVDPTEAATLTELARRWVLRALDHVPTAARQAFRCNVASNALLLDTGLDQCPLGCRRE